LKLRGLSGHRFPAAIEDKPRLIGYAGMPIFW
jgi:hypothetical protein